jgi:hypothetical protein
MMNQQRRRSQRSAFIICHSSLQSSFILSLAFPVSFDFVQEFINALALFFDAVPDEMKLGGARQIEGETELLPHKGRGVTQRVKRQPVLLFIPGYGDKNVRVAAILGQPDVRNSNHRQSWVFEFIPNDLGNFLTDNVCNSLGTTHG